MPVKLQLRPTRCARGIRSPDASPGLPWPSARPRPSAGQAHTRAAGCLLTLLRELSVLPAERVPPGRGRGACMVPGHGHPTTGHPPVHLQMLASSRKQAWRRLPSCGPSQSLKCWPPRKLSVDEAALSGQSLGAIALGTGEFLAVGPPCAVSRLPPPGRWRLCSPPTPRGSQHLPAGSPPNPAPATARPWSVGDVLEARGRPVSHTGS